MSKFIIEIDSDHPQIASILIKSCQRYTDCPEVIAALQSITLWEDDGSTFISKGDILFEGSIKDATFN